MNAIVKEVGEENGKWSLCWTPCVMLDDFEKVLHLRLIC